MNFGLPRTVRKFFNVSETLGGGASLARLGSRKKIRMAMRPGSDVRAGSTSNVHHGVVDGVADGANVFFGSARGSSHHARLDHGNAERGQNQNEANENHRRNRGSDGDKPRRVDGAEQKIGRSK